MLAVQKSVAQSIIGLNIQSLFGKVNAIPTDRGYVADITPDMARSIVETRNHSNRPISRNSVVAFAKEMKNGNWKLLTDAIAFDVNGNLINGQHRLLAVIMSETTQRFHIFENQPVANFTVYDTGKNRTAGDILSISGISNSASECKSLSSMIKFILNYEGLPTSANKEKRIIAVTSQANAKITGITNEIVLNYAQQNLARLQSSRTFATALDLPGKLKVPEVAGLYYLMSKINLSKTNSFFNSLSSGANLSADSPILHLNKALRYSDTLEHSSYKSSYKLALVVKAWKMYCDGKTMNMGVSKATSNRMLLTVRPTETITID
jgi:hypothetical protein